MHSYHLQFELYGITTDTLPCFQTHVMSRLDGCYYRHNQTTQQDSLETDHNDWSTWSVNTILHSGNASPSFELPYFSTIPRGQTVCNPHSHNSLKLIFNFTDDTGGIAHWGLELYNLTLRLFIAPPLNTKLQMRYSTYVIWSRKHHLRKIFRSLQWIHQRITIQTFISLTPQATKSPHILRQLHLLYIHRQLRITSSSSKLATPIAKQHRRSF